ncbi:23S rRNA (guanosine(2251)-2'-O)-methyltransferase RlmB [Draconibacterium sp. IB214405]|uniref:23S rRNA (guanosine(2251)-2'-O)-methyltransferase RlmB n=1 Tax=Draconibacterium sp. IB214405 TaxID=3097352 RepID=UPI002A16F16E|nr:23S rRNA (guanosine(2251)-2'-O)-methyltransferase RlmB [Draconibacterium sp. IB214405]MDX8341183.1 23S rRNA (guanosine(2251)-2'-O)-methyltransferase RlmB [Draconibacterium sp. IB214405]
MDRRRNKGINSEDFLFGTRAVIEAIKKGKTIDKILVKKGLHNELTTELTSLAKENDIAIQYVPIEKINRITRKNHQGVLAFVSPIEFDNIENVIPGIYEKGETPLLLVLDQITDVRNFGAIARSAECAGVQAIVIPEKGMARIGADAVKTSAGAIHNIPICKTNNLYHTVRFLQESGIQIVAATEKAETLFTDADMKMPLAIVMGSEDTGISPQILKLADQQLKIPILGKIESLNVSVSAALMVYEAVRQRN